MTVKKLSEVFSEAQKYLWDGKGEIKNKEEFICHAIVRVATLSGLHYSSRVIIQNAIFPESTLTNWLISEGVHYGELEDSINVQAHRLQWLKMLEAQFKED